MEPIAHVRLGPTTGTTFAILAGEGCRFGSRSPRSKSRTWAAPTEASTGGERSSGPARRAWRRSHDLPGCRGACVHKATLAPGPGLHQLHGELVPDGSSRRFYTGDLLQPARHRPSGLNSNKGTKTLTGFFGTFYARRTFGNSAAPKIDSGLVNQFWGLNSDRILQPLVRKVVLSQKVDMLQ